MAMKWFQGKMGRSEANPIGELNERARRVLAEMGSYAANPALTPRAKAILGRIEGQTYAKGLSRRGQEALEELRRTSPAHARIHERAEAARRQPWYRDPLGWGLKKGREQLEEGREWVSKQGPVGAAIATGDPLGELLKAGKGKAGELVRAESEKESAEPRTSPVQAAYYPETGMSWREEPGGMYLSARYTRQYGTWGQTYAGEGWRAVANRSGYDHHLHPAYTQTSLRWVDRPVQYRVGARTYQEL